MAKKRTENSTKSTKAEANSVDVSTIDSVIKTFYESVSFKIGKQPDYIRFRTLFRSEALLIPPKAEKIFSQSILDVELFVKISVENIVLNGLERRGSIVSEIARRMLSFGNIVHIFSTFEIRNKDDDPKPIQRGIYSVQLIREDHRWWIVSLMWEHERSELPLPRAYLV